ncbi:tRNA/rRNA methyltransferase [Salmonella enterica]|nr:tRNA/rRNA methyltransferase [Salmonella enterica]
MRVTIVLVAPARAENIGAAARAMKTMGFTDLRIVDSQAHLEPATRWVAHGSGDIIDNIEVFRTLADALHDVDFTVATTARSRAKFHYYASPAELVPLLQEKSRWMRHAALVFGREDSGLTNDELALAVMVYCYQLAGLMQQTTESVDIVDESQLQALRARLLRLLTTLEAADDHKLTDWLQQRIGLLGQRDTVMLHRLIHDIEKKLTK